MGGIIPASRDVSSTESLIPPSCDGRGAGGMDPHGEALASEDIIFLSSSVQL